MVVAAVLVGLAGCFDTLPAAKLCHPSLAECAQEDWDGDGVPNSEDDAPFLDVSGFEMVEVPEGRFFMGCNATLDSQCADDESPQHAVDLPTFSIDVFEVTANSYRQCVSTGDCPEPASGSTYFDANSGEHPVNAVSWSDAEAFCAWRGGRLPTEAEWEKAARGGCELYCDDGDDACCAAAMPTYPWGAEPASCALAVMDDAGDGCGEGGTWPVGSKTGGASPYGVQDMVGNVWEWVSDRYSSDYYDTSPAHAPGGPESGSNRVARGGSWLCPAGYLRAANRGGGSPGLRGSNLGFRCVRSHP